MTQEPKELFPDLYKALLDAFRSYSDLERMVRFELEENLNAITGGNKLEDVVFYLIDWAKSRGKRDLLIQGARKSNPGNPALKEFEEKYKNFLYEKRNNNEHVSGKRLKDILLGDDIKGVSLILDDSTSFVGMECVIGGRRIYLDSKLENVGEEGKTFGHLYINFPIEDFNNTENISIEDEIFISGLMGYIANHSSILRCEIENFGVIPAVLKNFNHLEELGIVKCKNVELLLQDIAHLISLRKLIIQETKLNTFPTPVLELSNLTYLDLSGNQLRAIPSEINRLANLSTLSLMNNPLENLPQELNEMKNLQSFLVEDHVKKNLELQ